jgi:hypothetical protein
MKKISLTILCLAGLLFASCDKDNTRFEGPFELKINETINLPGSNTGLQLKVESINDSRCPANAFCISLGNAIVKIKMTDNTGSFTGSELCIGLCSTKFNRQDTIRINNAAYSVTLEAVNPYPRLGNTETKSALISLKKL